MLAVVQNRDAASLMGINANAAVTAAFALSTAFAGRAGILIAPLYNIHSDMGTLFGIKAFAVAILGGITSAWGVMVAGLIFGVTKRSSPPCSARATRRSSPSRSSSSCLRCSRTDCSAAPR